MLAKIQKHWENIDKSLATILFFAIFGIYFWIAFSSHEWFDWGAYILPAANYAERGLLAVPQYGTHHGIDQNWGLSSWFMGTGPYLWFLVFGVGRLSLLSFLQVLGTINILVFWFGLKKLLQIKSLSLSLIVAFAFLGHRSFIYDIQSHRLDIIIKTMMFLIFFPETKKEAHHFASSWKWLLAGSMMLMHPSVAPICFLFIGWEIFRVYYFGSRSAVLAIEKHKILLFLMGFGSGIYWFLRDNVFQEQFLPFFQGFQKMPHIADFSSTLFNLDTSFQASFPSIILASLILLLLSFSILHFLYKRKIAEEYIFLVPIVCSLVFIFSYDYFRHFPYQHYYLFGMAPFLLVLFNKYFWQNYVLFALVFVAFLHLIVSIKMDLQNPIFFASQKDSIRYIVKVTKPGDKIVLGPPFIMASVPEKLPGNRKVVAVVPIAVMFLSFNYKEFREYMQKESNVYIGEKDFYQERLIGSPVHKVNDPGGPIYKLDNVQSASYFGKEIVIAKKIF